MRGLFSCLTSSWSIGEVFWEARWVSTLQVAPFTGSFARKTSHRTRSVLLTRSETDAPSPLCCKLTQRQNHNAQQPSDGLHKNVWNPLKEIVNLLSCFMSKVFFFHNRSRSEQEVLFPTAVGHKALQPYSSLKLFLFWTTWFCGHDLHVQTPVSQCLSKFKNISNPMTGGQSRTMTEQIHCVFQQIRSEFNY